MKRFPILQAYQSFLQFIAFILMIAGLIAGILVSQAASTFYAQANPDYNGLRDLLLKAVVFTVVYGIAMLIACIPLIIAEGLALRLSIEAQLYRLSHREDAPVYERGNRVQQKITQQMAAVVPGWKPSRENGNGKPVTEASRPARLRTGKTGSLTPAIKPVTGPLKREVLPGKPKTSPLRPPELREQPPEEEEEETAPVSEAPPVVPETTLRTQEMVALSRQTKTLRDPVASFNFRKAIELFEAEKFPEAIQLLDKALEIDSAFANAYRLRSACYRRTGEPERARHDLAQYMQYVAGRIPQG
jgi:tetratricopeptide (TPR) repeat protein